MNSGYSALISLSRPILLAAAAKFNFGLLILRWRTSTVPRRDLDAAKMRHQKGIRGCTHQTAIHDSFTPNRLGLACLKRRTPGSLRKRPESEDHQQNNFNNSPETILNKPEC
jgi:hypothetical protein